MKRQTKDMILMASGVVAVAALIAIGIYYEIAVWQECRTTNSWMYCMRVLSK